MPTNEKLYEEAQRRVANVAAKLAIRFGTVPAINLMAGSAVAMLESELGREQAARYLRELADEIETDADTTQGRA